MYHGIVEGYYGKPFSTKQRRILLNELSSLEGSAYFYAPKDDPWHRLLWREPYPDKEWLSLKNDMMASGGKVSFFFSISPWEFKDSEWDLAREKLLRAVDSGASGLSILFDDVPDESAGKLAERQLNFAKKALDGINLPVILCPSVYCGEFLQRFSHAEEYLQVWRHMIPTEWSSFWTGPMVVSKDFSDIQQAEELLGGKPVLWDNILATDYCLRRVYLAGLNDRVPSDYSWFINPSEIFPAALHGVMELKAAMGLKRNWPDQLGASHVGWQLMQEFHYLPWNAGETGSEILVRLSNAINGFDVNEALVWLNQAVADMSNFIEIIPSIEGGWQLLPVARDLYRSLSIIQRSLKTDDPGVSLHYFMHTRLPYENPVAALAGGKIKGV